MIDAETKWRRLASLLLFVGLFCVYQGNRTVLDEGDAVPSANLPIALIETGRLSFDPDHFPELFKWKSKLPLWPREDYFVMHWQERLFDKTALDFFHEGVLKYVGPRYYIVESRHPGVFVSTFGPIPALFALPAAIVFHAIDPIYWGKLDLRASVAKVDASLMVAACAVLLFHILMRFTDKWRALLLAVTYGMGTIAWAVSSQNLWQQTVNQLLLTWGLFHFLAGKDRRVHMILAGVLYGAATSNRATGAIPVLALSLYLYLRDRKNLIPFLLGTLPFPIAIGFYNWHYFGNPLTFAQELVGHTIAMEKTGSPKLFSTPVARGLWGLLVSPSRGLLIFSPILAPAFYGVYRIWEDNRYIVLRPLTVSVAITMLMQCAWFDWWGGHTFGYRPWVDGVPYLVVFMGAVITELTSTRGRQRAYAAVLSWSIAVEALGAFSYDRGWNLRLMHMVRVPGRQMPLSFATEKEARSYVDHNGGEHLGTTLCDIDRKWCRHRLWSWSDSLLVYQWTHYRQTRKSRMGTGWVRLGKPMTFVPNPYD